MQADENGIVVSNTLEMQVEHWRSEGDSDTIIFTHHTTVYSSSRVENIEG